MSGYFDSGTTASTSYFSGYATYVVETPREGMWKRHENGKEIKIANMVNEHLLSTIAMLRRGYDYKGQRVPGDRLEMLPALEAEAQKRGILAEEGWDL